MPLGRWTGALGALRRRRTPPRTGKRFEAALEGLEVRRLLSLAADPTAEIARLTDVVADAGLADLGDLSTPIQAIPTDAESADIGRLLEHLLRTIQEEPGDLVLPPVMTTPQAGVELPGNASTSDPTWGVRSLASAYYVALPSWVERSMPEVSEAETLHDGMETAQVLDASSPSRILGKVGPDDAGDVYQIEPPANGLTLIFRSTESRSRLANVLTLLDAQGQELGTWEIHDETRRLQIAIERPEGAAPSPVYVAVGGRGDSSAGSLNDSYALTIYATPPSESATRLTAGPNSESFTDNTAGGSSGAGSASELITSTSGTVMVTVPGPAPQFNGDVEPTSSSAGSGSNADAETNGGTSQAATGDETDHALDLQVAAPRGSVLVDGESTGSVAWFSGDHAVDDRGAVLADYKPGREPSERLETSDARATDLALEGLTTVGGREGDDLSSLLAAAHPVVRMTPGGEVDGLPQAVEPLVETVVAEPATNPTTRPKTQVPTEARHHAIRAGVSLAVVTTVGFLLPDVVPMLRSWSDRRRRRIGRPFRPRLED
jgi:hypothetical protein